jgi:hypothetical protein
MVGLDISYEEYVEINGGEFCGICGRPPSAKRRLDRDHSHEDGRPRGLLCARCNRHLAHWLTVEDAKWLRDALKYLTETN